MHLVLGGWRIDTGARVATNGDATMRLTPRAARLLDVLVQSDGALLTRDALLDLIWPDVTVGDDSLTQVVAEVRRALGDPKIIETIPRSGYRLAQPALRPIEAMEARDAPDPVRDLDLEAYSFCLEARAEVASCGRGSIERADALTAEAAAIAPDSAIISAERAIAMVRTHMYWSEGCDVLPAALAEARRAVALDPRLALAQSALGYAHAAAGHWAAADAAHRIALALDPRDPVICHNAAWLLMSRRQYRQAVVYFEQAGNLEPQNIKGYLMAAQIGRRLDPARGRRNAERALQRARTRLDADPRDPRALSASAVLMALLGEPSAAFTAMESIDVSASAQAIFHASAMAMIGEEKRAVALFEELFDHGWRDACWLDADPAFDALDDRRFLRMRQRLAAA